MEDISDSSCSDASAEESSQEPSSPPDEKIASKPQTQHLVSVTKSPANEGSTKRSINKARLVDTISKVDVLLGRGKRNQNWPGNELFREYVRVRSQEYIAPGTNKFVRDEIAKEIIEKVYQNGGRFLQEVIDTGTDNHEASTSPARAGHQASWRIATHSTIRTKTKQALRDIQKRFKGNAMTGYKKTASEARNLTTANNDTIVGSSSVAMTAFPSPIDAASTSTRLSFEQTNGITPLPLLCAPIPNGGVHNSSNTVLPSHSPTIQVPEGLRGPIPLRNLSQQSANYPDDIRLFLEALLAETTQQQQRGIPMISLTTDRPSVAISSSMLDLNQRSNSSLDCSSLLLQTLFSRQVPVELVQLLINNTVTPARLQQQQQQRILGNIMAQYQILHQQQQYQQQQEQQQQQGHHRGWLSLLPQHQQPLSLPRLPYTGATLSQLQGQESNEATQRLLLSLLLANTSSSNNSNNNTNSNDTNTNSANCNNTTITTITTNTSNDTNTNNNSNNSSKTSNNAATSPHCK